MTEKARLSGRRLSRFNRCLLNTTDAADEEDSVDLGGRRIIKKTFPRMRSKFNPRSTYAEAADPRADIRIGLNDAA